MSASDKILCDTEKMIMLGFGISSPDQVKSTIKRSSKIHGFVVGTAIIRILDKYLSIQSKDLNLASELSSFCRSMKSATII